MAASVHVKIADVCNKNLPTLSDTTRISFDETIETFQRHYTEKPVVIQGRLARRVQQACKNLKHFQG